MRRLWLAVPLLLSFVAPAHAAPEHAEIAFASGGKLWAARADGSERRLLGRGHQPVWSPDGSRLAYVREHEDESQIMLLGAGAITPLRKGVTDQSPAWSPARTRSTSTAGPRAARAATTACASTGSCACTERSSPSTAARPTRS